MIPALIAAVLSAVTWFPADGWREALDPVASARARKGGTIRFSGAQAPKSNNAYVDNNHYTSMMFSLMYLQLITTDSATLDFVPSLARRWSVDEKGEKFAFEIDPAAKWSDGVEITAADVEWTFAAVNDPKSDTGVWKSILGSFECKATDTLTVVFRKKGSEGRDWRDLMHCGSFPILPKHHFGKCDFNKLDFTRAPVSAAYFLDRVEPEVEAEYRRVKDWWRADYPSCRNVCNFDRILMRYFADGENAFEALKKRTIDVYPVYTARIMNSGTRGEKFERNWILKRRVRNHKPMGFQGFAMNMRRKPFDDRRVRKAMAKLLDRETMNRTMMSGEYFLQNSFVQDLYDEEHPCQNEFIGYDPEGARKLLAEAGYADGFKFTFLSRSATEDKFLSLFSQALKACGVEMEIVRKDFAGWMKDMDAYNFEMTWAAWGASVFRMPAAMWSSAEADRKGGNNICGFKSAEVDRLIEAEKKMMSMADRAAAYREMDRLETAECPYAFLWNTAETRLLYWNKFGMPEKCLGIYGDEDTIFTYWWYDDDRAEELERAISGRRCLPGIR